METLNLCKVINHSITIEYECPNKKETYTITLNDPSISDGQYFDDWHYTAISFECPHCKTNHSFEI